VYSRNKNDTPLGAFFFITDRDLCLNPCERPEVFLVAICVKSPKALF